MRSASICFRSMGDRHGFIRTSRRKETIDLILTSCSGSKRSRKSDHCILYVYDYLSIDKRIGYPGIIKLIEVTNAHTFCKVWPDFLEELMCQDWKPHC